MEEEETSEKSVTEGLIEVVGLRWSGDRLKRDHTFQARRKCVCGGGITPQQVHKGGLQVTTSRAISHFRSRKGEGSNFCW